jgi:hypothetical protein
MTEKHSKTSLHSTGPGTNQNPLLEMEEVIRQIQSLGWTEYPSNSEYCRFFEVPRNRSLPACACNDRAPPIQLYVWKPAFDLLGGVEFNICGERKGTWLKVKIHTVPYAEFMSKKDSVIKTAEAIWTTFYNEMG